MMSTGVWPYLGILGLLVLSAFFSGSETAYAKANRMRLRAATEQGSIVSKVAYYIYQSYDNALVTILICNNLVNIAASSVATIIAVSLLGDNGAWVATAVMTVLIIIFGEIIPKIVAQQIPEAFAKVVSIPLRVMMVLFFPLLWLITFLLRGLDRLMKKRMGETPSVTEEDLETILDTVEDEGVIDEDRADLLQSALDFDEVLAYEILTPRVDMVAIDIDDDKDEILRTIFDSPYSRIPIYRDTVDNVIGVLHLNRVFKALADGSEINLSQMMMPATFVYKTMALPDVLKVMKKRKSHLVVVTDEYGGTMGVLSMEDVLEQLVGDIWDESDEVDEEIVSLGGGRFDVDADMRIEDFFDELDIDDRDFDDENTTIGGWVIEQLGRYPRVGDQFDYRNLTFIIKKRRKLRVIRLLVVARPVEEEPEEY